MASIKNLKKDIDYTLGYVIGKCNMLELDNPKVATEKTEAIVDEAVTTFDELIAKVNAKNVENKKAHFKSISAELQTRTNALLDKVNAL